MKNAFASKLSYFILTFLFLIITASFLFSGFDNFSGVGGSKNVASVDGTPITTKEFETALRRQVEFFSQMMGGKGLTQKQLEEMGIKQSVLNGLIQQKLINNFADQMGLIISLPEIKNEIKNLPYFKTNDQFNVKIYRDLLQGNGYTPAQFEELIGDGLKQKKIDNLFTNLLISERFIRDVVKFKNNIVNVQAIKISRQSLAPMVSISEQEIKDYIGKPENEKNLENLYAENSSKYNKPEEIKARHILINDPDEAKALEKIKAIKNSLTPGNFASIASKETNDPSGKSSGGDLGWFARGRMVPEFEDVAFKMAKGEISAPVKTQFGYHIIFVEDKKAKESTPLEKVKPELAKAAIQKTKGQDLDNLMKNEQERILKLLEQGQLNELEVLQKKISAQFTKSADVNQYDQTIGQITLTPQEAAEIFKASSGAVLNFGNPGTIYLVRINSKSSADESKISGTIKEELASQDQLYGRKVRDELIKSLNNKAKIVTVPSLL
jgi:peptidyl-prolyl cis-trans isomerase D